VLRHLTGTATVLDLPQPAILVATDLTPSDTAQLDPTKVLGICTTLGSATSTGDSGSPRYPAVVGVGSEVLNLTNGRLDGVERYGSTEPDTWLHFKLNRIPGSLPNSKRIYGSTSSCYQWWQVTVVIMIGGIDAEWH